MTNYQLWLNWTSKIGLASLLVINFISFFNQMLIAQAKHKIQSAEGPLDMRLTQVPKMLSVIRKDWAPAAFCISFKVRTLVHVSIT